MAGVKELSNMFEFAVGTTKMEHTYSSYRHRLSHTRLSKPIFTVEVEFKKQQENIHTSSQGTHY